MPVKVVEIFNFYIMENFDFKSLYNVAKIDKVAKTIKVDKSKTIGIKLWGKIDYLVKQGYKLVTSNNVIVNNDEVKEKTHKRELKKQFRENKRNNNMNKIKKHK